MIEAMPPAQLVELINEWGSVPRVAAGEQEQPFPPTEGLALGVPDNLVRKLRNKAIQHVADRLHPVFTASTPAECAELVTEILTATGVHPVVRVTDDRAGAGWAIDAPSDALAAAAGLTLREHLGKHGFTRLGVCTGRNCADVYIDASPTHDRRYCSLTCQNRARAAAFRRRHAPNTSARC